MHLNQNDKVTLAGGLATLTVIGLAPLSIMWMVELFGGLAREHEMVALLFMGVFLGIVLFGWQACHKIIYHILDTYL